MSRVNNHLIKIVLISIAIFGGLVSCSKTTIDVNEIHVFGEEQLALSQLVNSRVQVYNVEYSKGKLSIALKDSIIKIDSEVFPFIYTNDQGHWIVNGEVLPNKISTNSIGDNSFPVLSISKDGFLCVDGQITNFSWPAKSIETISSTSGWIWAIVLDNSYLCLYRSHYDNAFIPVVNTQNHIVPDYFFELLVEKELKAEEIANSILPNQQLSYIFFTDAHWGSNQKHSPAIIKHIVDYTPITQVLFGGDANTSSTETIQGTISIGNQFHEAFKFLGSHFYCLYGNHDDNSTGQTELTDRHLSEEQVYAFLQSQMTDVHYWDYYNFYYDDPASMTRFICMDTGRFYNSAFRGAIAKTAKFAIESLSEVPNGWHIVAASHIWANLKDFYTGETQESVYIRPIMEILENYNLRKKALFSYNGESIEYDFSTAGANVEYCIGGHNHCDAVVTSKNGIPIIIVTCDAQQEVAGGAPYQTGTINEQCVTIVVNDYQNREVNILHIGRGDDVKVNMWDISSLKLG